VGAVTPCNVGPDQIPQATLSPEHTLVMAWLRDSGFHLLFPTLPPFRGWMLPGFRFDHTQEVATSQTTCLVVRAEVHRALAGMDASLFLFYNDVDYCRRLRGAGWRLVYLAETRVIHHGSASVETAPWKERQLWRDRYRFFRRWYGSAGTAGVRFACLHRMLTRVLAQLPKGRPAQMRRLWQEGLALYRTLAEERNGA
jgi:GT2 family glycosyltransferase